MVGWYKGGKHDGLQLYDTSGKTRVKGKAAQWFHDKWGVPTDAYLECMDAYVKGETEYDWYLCLDGDNIVGGLGVIENDFHDHTSFYECYGWEFLCMVQGDGEPAMSRMYIHKE